MKTLTMQNNKQISKSTKTRNIDVSYSTAGSSVHYEYKNTYYLDIIINVYMLKSSKAKSRILYFIDKGR